jgi:hypothetical protein
MRGLPPIPQAEFLRLKRLHLQQLRISESLEADPWAEIPKRRLDPFRSRRELEALSVQQNGRSRHTASRLNRRQSRRRLGRTVT